jgi:hypothetical protein
VSPRHRLPLTAIALLASTLRAAVALSQPAPAAATPPAVAVVAAPPIITAPLVCSHGALRSLVLSDVWSRLPAVCARVQAIEPLRFEPAPGVDRATHQGLLALCAEGRSARFVCGLDAYRRDLLITRFDAHVTAVTQRAETARRLCPEVEFAAAFAESAPEPIRVDVRAALTDTAAFCNVVDGFVPTAAQLALVRRAREVAVAARGRNLTPDAPGVSSLWAAAAPTPGAPQAIGGSDRGGGHGAQSGSAEARAESDAERSALPGAAGLVEVALRGIANLLVSRAQAEVEGFMLDQLRDIICSGDARPWFEHTCAYLVAPDAVLRITAGSALRTGFQADVVAFPRQIASRAPREGEARTLTGRLWFQLLAAATESRTLTDLGDRFSQVGSDFTCTGREPELCQQAKVAVEGSGLLMAYALNRADLETLSPTMFHAMLETVYARPLSIDAMGPVEALRPSLVELRNTLSFAQTPRLSNNARIPRVGALLTAMGVVFERGVEVAFFDRRGGDRVTLHEGVPAMYAAVMRGELTEIAVHAQRALVVVLPIVGLSPDVTRGMVLAAEIAQARTPEQIRVALESVVTPPGAWRLKRRRPMLSITGLVGVAGGAEIILASGVSGSAMVPSVGLVGALGLDVSFPARSSTLGFYVSVIDLGALLSLPLGDANVRLRGSDGVERAATLDVTSRISPEQVLSPGIFFRWGIGRSPFVFAAGASMVPFGRHVQEARASANASEAVYSADASVFRLSAMLAVDLTLFPF